MRKLLLVLPLMVAFALLSAGAWAVNASDDFEDATLGAIKDQNSGSGWNTAWYEANYNGDTRRAEVLQPGGEGTNQFLGIYGTSTVGWVGRQTNDSLWGVDNLWLSFDYNLSTNWAANAAADMYFGNGTSGNSVHLVFREAGGLGSYSIAYKDTAEHLVGFWDGRNADGTPNSDLDLINGWKRICFDVNVANNTYDFWIGSTKLAEGIAFRTAATTLDYLRFYGPKFNVIDPEVSARIDNIVISDSNPCIPEPGSLLALASGMVGLAGVAIRRRK